MNYLGRVNQLRQPESNTRWRSHTIWGGSTSSDNLKVIQRKGMFIYRGTHQVISDCSTRFTFHPPSRSVYSDTNSTSLASFQPCCNYCAKTKSLTHFHHCLQPGIHSDRTEVSWRERNCQSFEMTEKGIWTRAPSIEIPAFYCWANALHKV